MGFRRRFGWLVCLDLDYIVLYNALKNVIWSCITTIFHVVSRTISKINRSFSGIVK